MVTVLDTIHIDAPREAVWALMNNLERKKDYVIFVQEVFDIRKVPVSKGTTYQERAKFGPRIAISEWRFTEFDPPELQVQESRSSEMNGRFTGSLKAVGAGTTLSVKMEVTLLPIFPPLGWLLEKLVVERKMKKDIATTLQTLKTLVESTSNEDAA